MSNSLYAITVAVVTVKPVDTECRKCSANSVLAVLDKRIENKPTGGGNKYRRWCEACEAWNPMTSAEYYKNHPRPHVLPSDGDPENAANDIIPLSEYDYNDEWQDIVEEHENRVTAARTATDGGGPNQETEETETETEVSEESEIENQDETNEFVCPVEGCTENHTGYPDECQTCGAQYSWNDE